METPHDAWTRCRPYIEAALGYARDTHLVEDVRRMVEEGQAQFWPGRRAAVVTEIIEYPRLRALHHWLCGGDLAELMQMRPVIEAWARAAGCRRLLTAGRPGWTRVLRPHGFSPAWQILMKDL